VGRSSRILHHHDRLARSPNLSRSCALRAYRPLRSVKLRLWRGSRPRRRPGLRPRHRSPAEGNISSRVLSHSRKGRPSPQVPLVTADQQILFAQMAHLSLGVTLTSRLLVPAIDNVVPCQGETATLQWFASGLVSADFAPGRVLEEPASGERVAFESLSQLPFPIASRLDRPPRRGSAP